MTHPTPLPLPDYVPPPPQRQETVAPPGARNLARALLQALPDDDLTMQVQEQTTLRTITAVPRTPARGGDMQMVVAGSENPQGIVQAQATPYGPARNPSVRRPTAIETPEKARLREELERVKNDLRAADAVAKHATAQERHRVEHMANVAIHADRLRYESLAAEFENEANELRDLELNREKMFADARLNNTVHEAEQAMQQQANQIAAAEQKADLLGQQLQDSRNNEKAAYDNAMQQAAAIANANQQTTELQARIQQQYGLYYHI